MNELTELEKLAIEISEMTSFNNRLCVNAVEEIARIGQEISKSHCKVIDMSPMIESGLLCEFSDRLLPILSNDRLKTASLLTEIIAASGFSNKNGDVWARCTPLYNHWYASPTGWDKCPIPEGFEIEYLDVDSGIDISKSYKPWYNYDWNDVRIFRITRKLDDYKYQWEMKND